MLAGALVLVKRSHILNKGKEKKMNRDRTIAVFLKTKIF